MTRWLIWSQVAFALISAVANFADRGKLPRHLYPPQLILPIGAYSALIIPIAILILGGRHKSGSGQLAEIVASIDLSFAMILALLPMVQ